jgi:hypothetical protein
MGLPGTTEILLILIAAFPFFILYLLPTIIAYLRKKSNLTIIFLVNFFLGWSLVGWIVSLIWALSSENTFHKVEVKNPIPHLVEKSRSHQEISFDEKLKTIQKLKELLDSGVLTQAEFEEQKTKILSS